MARGADHEARRLEILSATRALIVERGIAKVSFREVGRRLGGSASLVSHYYSDREHLFRDLADESVTGWLEDLEAIELEHPDPLDRLQRLVFAWLLPLEGAELDAEKVRMSFVAAGLQGERTQDILDTWDEAIRSMLSRTLVELVPADRVETAIDLVRAAFSGVSLSALEHPDRWPPRRQATIMNMILSGLSLTDSSPSHGGNVAWAG